VWILLGEKVSAEIINRLLGQHFLLVDPATHSKQILAGMFGRSGKRQEKHPWGAFGF